MSWEDDAAPGVLYDDVIEIIRQMHPNVSMIAAMDDATLSDICKDGDDYKIFTGDSYDVYDQHNDDSVDTNLWTITTVSQGWVTEEGTEYLKLRAGTACSSKTNHYAKILSDNAYTRWHGIIKATTSGSFWSSSVRLYVHGASDHYINLPTDGTYRHYEVKKIGANLKIYENGTEKLSAADANTTFTIEYVAQAETDNGAYTGTKTIYVDKTGKTGTAYTVGDANGYVTSDAIAANAAVLSFFSHLKGKFSNGASSHANPVQVEIYGNGDSYAAALNATTKFKIDPADPRIELYRIDDSVVAKSGAQDDWVLDDNVTNGAFAAKTTSTHETILAEEIGCASVVMVEKSVNGAFTDTEILVEDDDYTVDYSTRTSTKIVLTSAEAADIVISQSKLRITWIADVEDIEGTANTALKMKIYLNRTATTEASPEIQKIDLGTDKYAEMKYMCG